MFFGLDLYAPVFWSTLGSIILINMVLSRDNAMVVAMVARTLKPEQRKQAIFWGNAAALVMRVVLTIMAIQLLTLPYLKLIGGVLLAYIGVDLLKGRCVAEGHGKENRGMPAAIRAIVVANLVMSLDNVLVVAAAARGNVPLLVLGLMLSIPLFVFCRVLLTTAMDRFPIIITVGAALLGFLAGEMLLTDLSVISRFGDMGEQTVTIAGGAGAVLVVVVGVWLQKRDHAAV